MEDKEQTPIAEAVIINDSNAPTPEALHSLREYKFDAADTSALYRNVGMRLDANQAMFASRELNNMIEAIYLAKLARKRAFEALPTNMTDRPNKSQFEWALIDTIGEAKIMANGAKDIPRANASTVRQTARVQLFGISFEMQLTDMLNSNSSGISIDQSRNIGARRGMEAALDRFAAVGNDAVGNTGFFRNAYVPLVTPIATGWTGATSSANILDSLAAAAVAPTVATEENEEADSMVLPLSTWMLISTKKVDGDSSMTILQQFKINCPFIKNFYTWKFADTASAGGTKRIVAYSSSQEVLSHEVTQNMVVMPPQARAFDQEFFCYARSAGCIIKSPKGLAYMDIGA